MKHRALSILLAVTFLLSVFMFCTTAFAATGAQDGVTAELKEFLQQYSTSQLLFCDGNGWVESNPDIKIYSNEEDQWLFACGYYEKK